MHRLLTPSEYVENTYPNVLYTDVEILNYRVVVGHLFPNMMIKK